MTLYQKVLSAGIALALVAFFAVGGTTAFFSDTEVSANNTFAAGSVDVGITGIDHTDANGEPGPNFTTNSNGMSFTLDDLKPLDEGEVSYDLENNANPAYVCALVEEGENAENDRLDQEEDAGDNTAGDPGTGNGELQDFLSFKFGGASGTLADVSGQYQGNADEVGSGSTTSSSLEYCFGEYDGSGNCQLSSDDDNVAQTDSVDVDVTFQAVQQRNNPNFTCAQLNNEDPDQDRQEVGADLDAYEAPENPDRTVNGDESADHLTIQEAVDAAGDGDTILVEDGDYEEDVEVDVDNLTIAAANQGGAEVDGGFSVESAGVTITGFAITGGMETDITANAGDRFGIRLGGDVAGGEASYNSISGIDAGSNVAKGIQVFRPDNVTVEHNDISDLTASSGGNARGIMIQHDADDANVEYNTVSVGDSSTSYAIAINVLEGSTGSGAASPENTTINFNEVQSVDGQNFNGGSAIGVEGSESDVDAQTNNLLQGSNTSGNPADDVELKADVIVDAEDNFFGSDGVNVDDQSSSGSIDTTPNEGSAYPSN